MNFKVKDEHTEFVELIGGEENFKSLIISTMVYQCENFEKEEPFLCDPFHITRSGPVIIVGIREMCGFSFLMDMVIDGNRIEAYLSDEVAEFFCYMQDSLFEDRVDGWSEEDIEDFSFVNGKICMISAEDGFVSSIEMIDHDLAYPIIGEYIVDIINEWKKESIEE